MSVGARIPYVRADSTCTCARCAAARLYSLAGERARILAHMPTTCAAVRVIEMRAADATREAALRVWGSLIVDGPIGEMRERDDAERLRIAADACSRAAAAVAAHEDGRGEVHAGGAGDRAAAPYSAMLALVVRLMSEYGDT